MLGKRRLHSLIAADREWGIFFLPEHPPRCRFPALRWPWRVFDCAEREQTACLLVWACYTFAILMRIVLDRNARDVKRTKTQRFKNSDAVKTIDLFR
jgi:hypothetical protein